MRSNVIFSILTIGWLAWLIPFTLVQRKAGVREKVDRRARIGILMSAFGYFILWMGPFWQRSPAAWRVVLAVAAFACGSAFAWTGTRSLGKQWRVDAGLNRDHELVQTGVYSIVRNPIYTSMLATMIGTGLLVSTWIQLAIALLLLVIGTQIRVRIEEGLLESRFGDQFRDYKRRVPAFIPFLRWG